MGEEPTSKGTSALIYKKNMNQKQLLLITTLMIHKIYINKKIKYSSVIFNTLYKK